MERNSISKKLFEGNTKGFRNHPQLIRFRKHIEQIASINFYLEIIWKEAESRSYNFNKSKFVHVDDTPLIDVTTGQTILKRNIY